MKKKIRISKGVITASIINSILFITVLGRIITLNIKIIFLNQ